jgi:hypothetical protein
MNERQLDWNIFNLTKDWYINDWKEFRSRNNYWETKDRLYRHKKKLQFKQFKYDCLIDYLK